MASRIYFGVLFNIKEGDNTLSNFYHIHRVTSDSPRWEVGAIKSSFEIDKRDPYNSWKRIREKAFEDLRKVKFSDYPSRRQCLFAIKNGEIEAWKANLLNGYQNYQIFEIELLSGKIIKLDESFFDYDNSEFGYKSDNELAIYYWGGQSIEGNMKPVFLFEGIFKVKNLVEEKIFDIQNKIND